MTDNPFTRECTDCDEDGMDPSLDLTEWEWLTRPGWARCGTCGGTKRAPIMCEGCDIDAATALTAEGYKLCVACKAEDDAANLEAENGNTDNSNNRGRDRDVACNVVGPFVHSVGNLS